MRRDKVNEDISRNSEGLLSCSVMAKGQKRWFTSLQSLITTAPSSVHRTKGKEYLGVSRDKLEGRISHMDATG